jgi:hypothetical protein
MRDKLSHSLWAFMEGKQDVPHLPGSIGFAKANRIGAKAVLMNYESQEASQQGLPH